jgi:3-deoxy-7-phosphoheptulonate synthase
MIKIKDVHVAEVIRFVPPRDILNDLPVSKKAAKTVVEGRKAIVNILKGEDKRLILAIGPCSVDGEDTIMAYAEKLAALSKAVRDKLLIIMRVYFEKPRTTLGWKGLINDPNLDGRFDIDRGLRLARAISLKINELGLPVATEVLDPIIPQYIADLVSWASIGARTTESQTHRQMASGLSMPIGFKNGTNGDLQVALNAMLAAHHSHTFLGIDEGGHAAIIQTSGNPWRHLILRGSQSAPNYHEENIEDAVNAMNKTGLKPNIMVDCSHGNSRYNFKRQRRAFFSVLRQRMEGTGNIIGLMLESYLKEGNQKLGHNSEKKIPGLSITDACIGWEETEELVREARKKSLSP